MRRPESGNAPAAFGMPAKRNVSAEVRMRSNLRRGAIAADIATQPKGCGGRWWLWILIICINLQAARLIVRWAIECSMRRCAAGGFPCGAGR